MVSKLHNEQELLIRVQQGDKAAFTNLFHHYRDKVYAVAYRLTHSDVMAAEIVTEVFLKIWLRRNTLSDIHHFSAYLFTIVRHDVYRALRKNAKAYAILELTECVESPTEDLLLEKECDSLLRQAINRLPDQQRKVYQLIKEQDMSRKAVARVLDIDPETVKFHLARAMKNIRSFCVPYLKTYMGPVIFHILLFA